MRKSTSNVCNIFATSALAVMMTCVGRLLDGAHARDPTPASTRATRGLSEMQKGRTEPISPEQALEECAPSHPKGVHDWVKTVEDSAIDDEIRLAKNDLHKPDERGLTALHWAARLGNKRLVAALLKHGCDPNVACTTGRFKGQTPLAFLMDTRFRPLGLNPTQEELADLRSTMAKDAFFCDRQLPREYTEIARLLILSGAHVNCKDMIHNTPLMKAAQAGHYEIARVLVENGADANLRNGFGKTARDIARSCSAIPEMIELLRNAELHLAPASQSQPSIP